MRSACQSFGQTVRAVVARPQARGSAGGRPRRSGDLFDHEWAGVVVRTNDAGASDKARRVAGTFPGRQRSRVRNGPGGAWVVGIDDMWAGRWTGSASSGPRP